MANLRGTQTAKNILTAFAGESQARNRYEFFASVAKKDGFVLVSDIFAETARQEKEHAKRLFKFLEGGEIALDASFPAGIIANTHDNLISAAAGENHEHTKMYPQFANIADDEGFSEIAKVMRNIAIAESYHERRFLALAKEISENRMFVRERSVIWRCRNCGCLVEGEHAPDTCPACNHPRAHFEELNYAFQAILP